LMILTLWGKCKAISIFPLVFWCANLVSAQNKNIKNRGLAAFYGDVVQNNKIKKRGNAT